MNRATFIHLHLRSQFSLLESTIKFEPLFARLKELQMPGVALTDKGNLFGAIAFYQGCKANGLKPILGLEVLVASGSRFDPIEGPRRADKAHGSPGLVGKWSAYPRQPSLRGSHHRGPLRLAI